MSEVKLYRVTRSTKQYVWLRWNGYGSQQRGLSSRITQQDFKRDWLLCAKRDGLDPSLYFKRRA